MNTKKYGKRKLSDVSGTPFRNVTFASFFFTFNEKLDP